MFREHLPAVLLTRPPPPPQAPPSRSLPPPPSRSLPPPRSRSLPPPPSVPPSTRAAGLPFSNTPTSPSRAPAAPLSALKELEAGAILADQYRVERVVGKVGSCMLVKVRSVRHDRRLLLKYLLPKACSEPFAVAEFSTAARLAMRLQSEHAAHTLDLGTLASGVPYVVTESFEGPELRDILRIAGSLPHTDAVDAVLQAAHALAEAHRQGIAHGSLSPSALLMTRGPEGQPLVKVLDFGSSATLRTDPFALRLQHWTQGTAVFTESIRLWDTVACTAPERLRDTKEATCAGDIWALGAILYELLLGTAPFSAARTPALLAAIAADELHFPRELGRGVPRRLKGVVRRCLSKSPDARFQSIHELALALGPFASPETRALVHRIARLQSHDVEQASWFPTSGASRRSRPVKRAERQGWMALLVLLALGVVGGVGAGKFGLGVLAARARGSQHAASLPMTQRP